MADQDRDFTQLSDDEVMNLGTEDFARMAAAEETQAALAGESDEDREARVAAEAEAAANGNPDDVDQGDEETGEEEPAATTEDESEEDRLAREAEEEKDLDEEELAELRANRDEAKTKALEQKQVQKPAKPSSKSKQTPDSQSSDAFDADSAKKLFAPFTANGRKMSIRNADEGVRLMQLGAGYNAKMEALKPDLAVIATLRREGLLDTDKLSFLIDLHKKNPEAIGKLVKDSGVDVLDLDEAKVAGYKPGNYATSTKEVEMDQILDGLKDSPTYGVLMDNVANKWDRESKQEVGNNPAILQRINQHMQAGFYDKIVDEVNRQKALGEIPGGTPFLAAYAKVGDELNAAGAFGQQEAPPARKLVTPGKAKGQNREVDEQRRRAAAPTKTAGNPAPKKPVVDVWNMSDADFEKLKV